MVCTAVPPFTCVACACAFVLSLAAVISAGYYLGWSQFKNVDAEPMRSPQVSPEPSKPRMHRSAHALHSAPSPARSTPSLARPRPASGAGIEEHFSYIYDKSKWGRSGGGSGDGSTELGGVGASRILFGLVMALNVSSMIDAPCGAMVWQRSLLNQLLHNRRAFRYLGIDVVSSVIAANRHRFQNTSWSAKKNATRFNPDFRIAFERADLASSSWSVPRGYDLIFSRDALQHNKLADVWQILERFASSDAKYVMLGSYPAGSLGCTYTRLPAPPSAGVNATHVTTTNRDLPSTGDFFCVDLRQPPFRLTPMMDMAEADSHRKHLYVFDRARMRAELYSQRQEFVDFLDVTARGTARRRRGGGTRKEKAG